MKNKVLFIISTMMFTNQAFAYPPTPGDIVARDLMYPGIGWLGYEIVPAKGCRGVNPHIRQTIIIPDYCNNQA